MNSLQTCRLYRHRKWHWYIEHKLTRWATKSSQNNVYGWVAFPLILYLFWQSNFSKDLSCWMSVNKLSSWVFYDEYYSSISTLFICKRVPTGVRRTPSQRPIWRLHVGDGCWRRNVSYGFGHIYYLYKLARPIFKTCHQHRNSVTDIHIQSPSASHQHHDVTNITNIPFGLWKPALKVRLHIFYWNLQFGWGFWADHCWNPRMMDNIIWYRT